MALTRDFKTIVLEQAQAEPEFRIGLLTEAAECLLNNEPGIAKTPLRDRNYLFCQLSPAGTA